MMTTLNRLRNLVDLSIKGSNMGGTIRDWNWKPKETALEMGATQ
jgi:hypothetical protein